MKKVNNSEDIQSVERIIAGDTAEFRLLVERHKDVSFSLACSILKNEQEAEDALQEAFIKLFKNIRKFRNQSSFSTWLYRIVVNTCLTIDKKKDKTDSYDNPANSITERSEADAVGDDSIISRDRKEVIQAVLKMMKTDEALLLRLYYLSELDVHEIKEVTGFSESKIKITLHRGRASLQEKLSKYLGNELELFIK